MAGNKKRRVLEIGRDSKLLIEFLNFDFSGYRKLSRGAVPGTWLRWFLGRHDLDSPRGWRKAHVLQQGLREALQSKGQLIYELNRHARSFVWEEEGESVVPIPVMGTSAKDCLYVTVLGSRIRGELQYLSRCENPKCNNFFFGKTKYCDTRCMGTRHNDEAPERVKNSRRNKRYREIRRILNKLRARYNRLGLTEVERLVPDMDPELLNRILTVPEKDLSRLDIKYKNRRALKNIMEENPK